MLEGKLGEVGVKEEDLSGETVRFRLWVLCSWATRSFSGSKISDMLKDRLAVTMVKIND